MVGEGDDSDLDRKRMNDAQSVELRRCEIALIDGLVIDAGHLDGDHQARIDPFASYRLR